MVSAHIEEARRVAAGAHESSPTPAEREAAMVSAALERDAHLAQRVTEGNFDAPLEDARSIATGIDGHS